MRKLLLLYLIFVSIHAVGQKQALPLKMEVPSPGGTQNLLAISYEPLAQDKFSILYIQELPATIVGGKEYISDKTLGAFADQEGKKPVAYSDRVIFLIRQTLSSTAEASTDHWVVALRELPSGMSYSMQYPQNFEHPIVMNGAQVNYSLKNLDQIKGLTAREFEALVLLGRQKYGFYKYPEPTQTVAQATLVDELVNLQSGFKELKAAMGRGDIPKSEKVLFKRDVVGKVRMVATKIDKKDSVEVKLYLATSDEANYELLKSQTFKGSINPNHASALVYDESLKVAGAYGYVLLKYKDESGKEKANALALGIDSEGEPQFWKVEAGKNALNSFIPSFSYLHDDGIYVISRNSEKVFKPFDQHHLLKKDGTAAILYPTDPSEVGSEKFKFMETGQAKPATGHTSGQFSTDSNDEIPLGIFELNKSRFIFTGVKNTQNNGATVTTTYGNLSVMRIDGENKIREKYELVENKSARMAYPRILGYYQDKAYFMINYPNKFKLVLSEDKVEPEQLENNAYRLVYMANEDYVVSNEFGSMFLTKSIVGNKYVLEFFPRNQQL